MGLSAGELPEALDDLSLDPLVTPELAARVPSFASSDAGTFASSAHVVPFSLQRLHPAHQLGHRRLLLRHLLLQLLVQRILLRHLLLLFFHQLLLLRRLLLKLRDLQRRLLRRQRHR